MNRAKPAGSHSLKGSVPSVAWLALEKPLILLWKINHNTTANGRKNSFFLFFDRKKKLQKKNKFSCIPKAKKKQKRRRQLEMLM